jgi:UDP-N-acetylmuramate--alanine ligase
VLPRVRRKIYTYGESTDADFRLQLLPKDDDCNSCFEVNYKGLVLGRFRLHVPGRHNVLNATAAVAVGVQLGVAPDQIAAGLETFRGVDRRFQMKGAVREVTVVDDYGHHPTEILATLRAARECGYGRVHVLFQPHRYTRTRDLMVEFANAFGDADTVQVLDIYAASEEPIAGVYARALVKEIDAVGACTAEYAKSMSAAVATLVREAGPGDVILTLGAGSISQAGPMLLEALATNG